MINIAIIKMRDSLDYYNLHTKNVYLNPKPPRNDHQVNQTQRSPIKGKTSDVKIKMKNKSSQDLKSGS